MNANDELLRAGRELGEALARLLTVAMTTLAAEQARLKTPTPKPLNEEKKKWLNAREAAKFLDVSPRTLWGLTSPRGPIPVARIGRILRYDTEDLLKVTEQMKSQGGQPK